jgi:hypothetical protein
MLSMQQTEHLVEIDPNSDKSTETKSFYRATKKLMITINDNDC